MRFKIFCMLLEALGCAMKYFQEEPVVRTLITSSIPKIPSYWQSKYNSSNSFVTAIVHHDYVYKLCSAFGVEI